MVLLRDFAEERQTKTHTIATYIRRHPDEFKGHIKMDGNKMAIDDVAVELLSKVYKLPAPDRDWNGLESEKEYYLSEYILAMRRIEKLREKIETLQEYEYKYRSLETSYQHQLEAETSEAKDEAVAEALAKAAEEKAAEIAALKESHQKEIKEMSFFDWFNRKK